MSFIHIIDYENIDQMRDHLSVQSYYAQTKVQTFHEVV